MRVPSSSSSLSSSLFVAVMVATALAAFAACDDGADSLEGGPSRRSPLAPPGGEADASPAAIAVKARGLFDALLPDLNQACGNACHAPGTGGAPKWLDTADPYKAATAYKGIVVKDVASSILLTKAPHFQVLEGALRKSVTDWLTLEAQGLATKSLPTTPAFVVADGANTVDIGLAGLGVDGAKLTFDAKASGTLLTLSNLVVKAPPKAGVRITSPLFYAVPASGAEVADTSMSNVDQTTQAGENSPLGPGLLILTSFPSGARLRIAFTALSAVQPALDAGAGGCTQVAAYVANAKPALQPCVGCHAGGNAGATGAMSLRAYDTDDKATCAQALTQVNRGDNAKSPILLAPQQQGGFGTHPGVAGLAGDFVDKMNAWISLEK